ncbi:MAG: M55 family metallopeptidase [Armatimonadota bacterium]
MKIYLMTDMEGVAGIRNHDDWVLRESKFYAKGRRLLTLEVNAAVDGLLAGGATDVAVVDGHGAGGIEPALLDPRAQVLNWKTGGPPYPFGLDSTFDGCCCVGQHAKAGTEYSHITHTGWFNVIDIRVNGISIGEYGEMALCAQELGVPCILACGEEALCREAEALTLGVVTVPVKWGLLPDGLDDLDTDQYRAAKLDARHLPPRTARRRIRAGALAAVTRLRDDPASFHVPAMHPPYEAIQRTRQWGDRPPATDHWSHPGSLIALFNRQGA